MSERLKSTSPSAIQVKYWRKTVSIEDKLDIADLKRVNELLTYDVMLAYM
jgi:hypothetical protein